MGKNSQQTLTSVPTANQWRLLTTNSKLHPLWVSIELCCEGNAECLANLLWSITVWIKTGWNRLYRLHSDQNKVSCTLPALPVLEYKFLYFFERLMTNGCQLRCECAPIGETRFGEECGRPPSLAIVEAVAAIEGITPEELDAPLYHATDLESINQLFIDNNDTQTASIFLRLSIAGWTVFIRGDGIINSNRVRTAQVH